MRTPPPTDVLTPPGSAARRVLAVVLGVLLAAVILIPANAQAAGWKWSDTGFSNLPDYSLGLVGRAEYRLDNASSMSLPDKVVLKTRVCGTGRTCPVIAWGGTNPGRGQSLTIPGPIRVRWNDKGFDENGQRLDVELALTNTVITNYAPAGHDYSSYWMGIMESETAYAPGAGGTYLNAGVLTLDGSYPWTGNTSVAMRTDAQINFYKAGTNELVQGTYPLVMSDLDQPDQRAGAGNADTPAPFVEHFGILSGQRSDMYTEPRTGNEPTTKLYVSADGSTAWPRVLPDTAGAGNPFYPRRSMAMAVVDNGAKFYWAADSAGTYVMDSLAVYTITSKITSHPEGGTVTPTSDVMWNGNRTYKATPKPGYKLTKLIVDGKDVPITGDGTSATSFDFKAVTADHTFVAEFEPLGISTLKTVKADGEVTVGSTVTWTINTTPTGGAGSVPGVTTTDVLPDYLQYVSSSAGTYDQASRTLSWTRDLPGEGDNLTVSTRIVSMPPARTASNTATVTSKTACADTAAQGCASTVTTKVLASDFTPSKTSTVADTNDNGYVGDAGDTITYQVKVANTGESTLTTAKVSDPMLGVSDLECLTSPLAPGGTAACDLGAKATHVITAAEATAGKVTNTATVCLDEALGVDCKPATTTTTTVNPSFSFTKTSTLKPVDERWPGREGDTITYSFSFTNTGNVDLTNPTITDPMLNLKGVACQVPGGVVPVGKTVTCANTYDHIITSGDVDATKVDNTATGHIPGLPDQGGKATDKTIWPAFTFTKSQKIIPAHEMWPGREGDQMTYWFTFTNTGNVDLPVPTINDTMLGLKAVACQTAKTAIKPGESVTCENVYTYAITAGDVKAGKVVNKADGNIPGLPSVADEVTQTTMAPAFTITKSATIEPVHKDWPGRSGDTIRYSFTVTNTGNVPIPTSAVTIDDPLVGVKGASCQVQAASIEPGQAVACGNTYAYKITTDDVKAGAVKNTATGHVPGLPEATSTTSTVTINPAFTLDKKAEIKPVHKDWPGRAGDEIVYTFTVTNTGNVPIPAPTITDEMVGMKGVACVLEADSIPAGQSATCTNQARYTITEQDVKAGVVKNTATASIPGLPDTDADVETATMNPAFTLTKKADAEKVKPGGKVTYSFEVTNTGDQPLKGVTITDPMLGVKAQACLGEDEVIEVGKTVTCDQVEAYTYTVPATALDKQEIVNTATASIDGLPDATAQAKVVVDNPPATPLAKTGAQVAGIIATAVALTTLGAAMTGVAVRRKRA